jgi:hypothetical protein
MLAALNKPKLLRNKRSFSDPAGAARDPSLLKQKALARPQAKKKAQQQRGTVRRKGL